MTTVLTDLTALAGVAAEVQAEPSWTRANDVAHFVADGTPASGSDVLRAAMHGLPKAGGRLARYFDPDSVSDAYGVILAAIEDPEGLHAWEAEVIRGFEPVPWSSTADALLRSLGVSAMAN